MSRLEDMKTEYDTVVVPDKLKAGVLKSIEQGKADAEHAEKKRKKTIWFRGAGMVAAAAIALIVTVNTSATVSQAMEQVPVLGAIVKVVCFHTFSDTQEKKQMEADIRVPEVRITGIDGKVLTKESRELNAAVSGYLEQIIAQYQKDVSAVADGEDGHEAVSSDYRIVTDNEQIFSLRVDTVIAMAGSDSFTRIYNIDKKTGKQMTLGDLFEKGSDYRARISDDIKQQMREQMKKDESLTYFIDDDQPEWDFDEIAEDANFYLNEDDELTIVFDKYEVAPGYMGMVEFEIPTEVLSDIRIR